MGKIPVETFQDLGEMRIALRQGNEVGPSGVSMLTLDENSSHAVAMAEFREVLDEHYSERLDAITEEGDRLIVERVELRSDDMPYMEYTVVEGRDE